MELVCADEPLVRLISSENTESRGSYVQEGMSEKQPVYPDKSLAGFASSEGEPQELRVEEGGPPNMASRQLPLTMDASYQASLAENASGEGVPQFQMEDFHLFYIAPKVSMGYTTSDYQDEPQFQTQGFQNTLPIVFPAPRVQNAPLISSQDFLYSSTPGPLTERTQDQSDMLGIF
jgi:hypothetical protein